MSPTHSSVSRQVRKCFLKHPVTASQTSVQSLSAVSHPFLLPAMEPRQAHLSSPAPCPVKCHHHSCTVCLLTYCDLSEAAKHHHLRYFHPPPKNQFSLPCRRYSRRTQVLTCRKKLGKAYEIASFWKEVKRGEKAQIGPGLSCVLHITHCEVLTCYSYKSQRPSAGAQVSGSPTPQTPRPTEKQTVCACSHLARASNALRSGKGAGLESCTLCAPGKHPDSRCTGWRQDCPQRQHEDTGLKGLF